MDTINHKTPSISTTVEQKTPYVPMPKARPKIKESTPKGCSVIRYYARTYGEKTVRDYAPNYGVSISKLNKCLKGK